MWVTSSFRQDGIRRIQFGPAAINKESEVGAGRMPLLCTREIGQKIPMTLGNGRDQRHSRIKLGSPVLKVLSTESVRAGAVTLRLRSNGAGDLCCYQQGRWSRTHRLAVGRFWFAFLVVVPRALRSLLRPALVFAARGGVCDLARAAGESDLP